MSDYIYVEGSRKDLIKEFTSPKGSDFRESITLLQYDSIENECLWVVNQSTWVASGRKELHIYCYELHYSKELGLWGYRCVSETQSMPQFLDCPLKFLDKVPDPHLGFSTLWRQKVAEYHKTKKQERKRR